jgi:predicted RNA-binding protein with TRAM domain
LTVPKLLALLVLAVVATGAVVYLVVRPKEKQGEVVVTTLEPQAAAELKINTQETVDATQRTTAKPELGRRYRVRVESESREGTEGIAHIGGQVIFVQGGRPGQEVLVEITRLRKTTAEAIIIKEEGRAPVASATASSSTSSAVPAGGTVYTGTVVYVGKFGDGLVKVNGMSVYVPGVEKGDRISFVITEQRDKFSNGQLISKLGASPVGAEERPAPAAARVVETRAPHIQPGQELELNITEKERRNPEQAGVGRIDGLVVIVQDTKPGDRVKVRITERKATLALAEIVERLESKPVAP